MKVYLTTTSTPSANNPWAFSELNRIKRLCLLSNSQNHTLTLSPVDADVVLFCGSSQIYHSDILRSDLFRTFWKKSMILDLSDRTLPLLPGLYTSLAQGHFMAGRAYHSLPYFRVAENDSLVGIAPIRNDATYLYSFVGRRANSPSVRGDILSLSDDRALLKDSSTGQKDGSSSFAQTFQDSKFVLCPRGLCLSTWRIYEAMKAGRVPVIISDFWIPPEGIDWESFSIRVPESEVRNLPIILRSREDFAQEMGAQARIQFHSNIGLGTSFDWLCARLNDISLELSKIGRSCYQNRIFRSLSSSEHRIQFLKEKINELYLFAKYMAI